MHSVFWETQTKKIIIVNRLCLGYELPSSIVKAISCFAILCHFAVFLVHCSVEKPVGAGECFPIEKLQVKSLQENFCTLT